MRFQEERKVRTIVHSVLRVQSFPDSQTCRPGDLRLLSVFPSKRGEQIENGISRSHICSYFGGSSGRV